MPVYCYECKDCQNKFETRHSMSFDDQNCIDCNSKNVFKIPALAIYEKKLSSSAKSGNIVNQYIADVKEELKTEKEKLKKEEL